MPTETKTSPTSKTYGKEDIHQICNIYHMYIYLVQIILTNERESISFVSVSLLPKEK